MMHDAKKVAAMIVRGMDDYEKSNETAEQEVKKPEEKKDEYKSTTDVESAMAKFIEAVHEKDAAKAADALMEFQDMCSGAEYISSEED